MHSTSKIMGYYVNAGVAIIPHISEYKDFFIFASLAKLL